MKTTLDSFAHCERGIPMDSLPATFRDVVIIARNLGFRYLWIDALRIIQDSLED
jgi:hypothetical protein